MNDEDEEWSEEDQIDWYSSPRRQSSSMHLESRAIIVEAKVTTLVRVLMGRAEVRRRGKAGRPLAKEVSPLEKAARRREARVRVRRERVKVLPMVAGLAEALTTSGSVHSRMVRAASTYLEEEEGSTKPVLGPRCRESGDGGEE